MFYCTILLEHKKAVFYSIIARNEVPLNEILKSLHKVDMLMFRVSVILENP